MQRLTSPRRPTPTPREQPPPPVLGPALRLPRPRRTPRQSFSRVPLVSSPPFISGLSTDPMRTTERRKISPAYDCRTRKPSSLLFSRLVFPRHIASENCNLGHGGMCNLGRGGIPPRRPENRTRA